MYLVLEGHRTLKNLATFYSLASFELVVGSLRDVIPEMARHHYILCSPETVHLRTEHMIYEVLWGALLADYSRPS